MIMGLSVQGIVCSKKYLTVLGIIIIVSSI